MSKKYAEIPVIVLTGHGTPQIKAKVESIGSTDYFEKPVDIKALIKRIFKKLEAGATGKIHGITLASFLQLVEMESKTCTLTVKANGNVGYIYFLKGDIIAAETGEYENEEAAHQILSWENSVIEIDDYCKKTEKKIKQPLMYILMEGLKMKDERDSLDSGGADEDSSDVEIDASAAMAAAQAMDDKEIDETVDMDVVTASEGLGLDDDSDSGAKEKEPPVQGIEETSIEDRLKTVKGVLDYGIFDSKDFLKTKTYDSGSILELVPSIYMSVAEELKKTIQDKNFQYIVINTKNGVRYCLLKRDNHHLIVGLKPGIRPVDFIKELSEG